MYTLDFQRIDPGCQALLDLGCGEGRHLQGALWHLPGAKVIGLDISASDLAQAQQKLRGFDQWLAQLGAPAREPALLIRGDGSRLPLATASLDLVICSEVLEHLPSSQFFLAEIHRVLKPGGQCVISVPRRWPERICWWLSQEYHQVPGGHIRILNPRELDQELRCANLLPEAQHHAHALHTPYWWLRCWLWQRGEQTRLCRWYHRFLVWDLMAKPWITRALERALNPWLGKSLVIYCRKPHRVAHTIQPPSALHPTAGRPLETPHGD